MPERRVRTVVWPAIGVTIAIVMFASPSLRTQNQSLIDTFAAGTDSSKVSTLRTFSQSVLCEFHVGDLPPAGCNAAPAAVAVEFERLFVAAMKDASPEVRRAGVQVYANISRSQAAGQTPLAATLTRLRPRAIDAIADPDAFVVAMALEYVMTSDRDYKNLTLPKPSPRLFEAVGDPDPTVVRVAIDTLLTLDTRFSTQPVSDELESMLVARFDSTTDPALRPVFTIALGRLDSVAAESRMVKSLRSSDLAEELAALEAIRLARPRAAALAVVDALRDPDPRVRAAAVDAFGQVWRFVPNAREIAEERIPLEPDGTTRDGFRRVVTEIQMAGPTITLEQLADAAYPGATQGPILKAGTSRNIDAMLAGKRVRSPVERLIEAVCSSDTVVLGVAHRRATSLNKARTMTFTHYDVEVSQVLSGEGLTQGAVAPYVRAGGTATLDGGQVSVSLSDVPAIATETPTVFFLRSVRGLDAWRPSPARGYDVVEPKNETSVGMPEHELIAAIRRAPCSR